MKLTCIRTSRCIVYKRNAVSGKQQIVISDISLQITLNMTLNKQNKVQETCSITYMYLVMPARKS